MVVVYEAEDLNLKRHVALKFLPDDLIATPEAMVRFRREAQSASPSESIYRRYRVVQQQVERFPKRCLKESEEIQLRQYSVQNAGAAAPPNYFSMFR